MEIAVLGIDLGKTVCSLAGVDGTGAVVMRNVRRRMIWDSRADLGAEVIGSSGSGYAA